MLMNNKERVLLLSGNLWTLGAGMLGPLFAVYSQKIGGSILDISWVYSVYLIVSGLAAILVGKVADMVPKRQILILGFFLSSLSSFGYLIANTQLKLLLVQCGIGLSAALINPTWYALFSENENRHRDGFLWGVMNGTSYIVTGIAIILGGLIVKTFSFPALFVTMGTIELLSTIWLLRSLKR